ncbi:MAG: hypothetical protein ABIJ34_06255 [archaeon]
MKRVSSKFCEDSMMPKKKISAPITGLWVSYNAIAKRLYMNCMLIWFPLQKYPIASAIDEQKIEAINLSVSLNRNIKKANEKIHNWKKIKYFFPDNNSSLVK